MVNVFQWLADLLGALLRVALWLLTAVLALGLLALALVLLALGVLWAVVRGRKPSAPVIVGRFQRYATERVWPGAPGRAGGTATVDEVVDVEVREVSGMGEPPQVPPRVAGPR